MRAQGPVQLIQLLSGRSGHGDGDAQVFAAFALAQLNRAGVKLGVELVGDVGDGVDQAIHFDAHDLDREQRGVLDQGFLARVGGV